MTALVAYFLGALLTARLAAQPDAMIGMLHGVVLWSFSSAALLVLGYWGVGGVLETGQTVLRTTATGISEIASGVATRCSPGGWRDRSGCRYRARKRGAGRIEAPRERGRRIEPGASRPERDRSGGEASSARDR